MTANDQSKRGISFSVNFKLSALSALMLLSGLAHAQSSVTLYGIADAGLAYTSNAGGKHQYVMTSGGENGDRWGLKGIEDLGAGLKAIFTLEAGYNIGTGTIGQNGTEFGRQAFVGLSSDRYGTVTLGRQITDLSWFVGPLIAGGNWAAGGYGYGAHVGDVDNLDGSYKINNAVKYQSINFNGLSFGGLYSFGGIAGNFTQKQVYDFDVAYTNGPLSSAIAYEVAKNPNYSYFGDKANDSPTANNISSPTIAGYASAGSKATLAAGVAYALGQATLGFEYSNVRFSNLGATAVTGLNAAEASYRGTATFNVGEASLKYNVTPSLLLATAYSYTHDGGAAGRSSAHYNQVDLGAIYSLSKRTSLYLIGVYQAASGTSSTGAKAVAAIYGATPSASNRQTVVTTGILHKF
jgi:predicted porin